MKTVCLCMIVKNEAPTIERCLRSVLPFIDAWVVCDTGSTDGTQKIVTDFFGTLSSYASRDQKPGALFEHDWVSFDANRNAALQLAWERADYALVVDADDVLAGKHPRKRRRETDLRRRFRRSRSRKHSLLARALHETREWGLSRNPARGFRVQPARFNRLSREPEVPLPFGWRTVPRPGDLSKGHRNATQSARRRP